MKKTSKFMMFFLLFALILSLLTPVQIYAITDNMPLNLSPDDIIKYVDSSPYKNTVVVNELDFVKKLKSYTKSELYEMGCTKEEVESIINYDYNQALLDYAKQDETILKGLGYTRKQIKDLKMYDGRTDAITYADVNSLSSATLTFNWAPALVNNTNQFNIFYDTNWSSKPIFTGTDIIAFSWNACDSLSRPISMKENSGGHFCYAQYWYGDTWYSTEEIIDTPSVNNTSFNIRMYTNNQIDALYWAKVVSGSIRLATQSNSYNLSTIQICAAYGHSTITISPSVSFSYPPSVGISFNSTMQNLYNTLRTYKYNGTLIN